MGSDKGFCRTHKSCGNWTLTSVVPAESVLFCTHNYDNREFLNCYNFDIFLKKLLEEELFCISLSIVYQSVVVRIYLGEMTQYSCLWEYISYGIFYIVYYVLHLWKFSVCGGLNRFSGVIQRIYRRFYLRFDTVVTPSLFL